ncbi:uncharacterized protein LOC121400667 [Xenopus laevis]|uniref:Uncharacterized protein LOC121400667 n=3 Tax=Xenopus laevis TaxID=8355 RepID=A0A8J1MGS4_XENLA|nr:uncharacterized protein LOC121400667 [Xenopus laevis]
MMPGHYEKVGYNPTDEIKEAVDLMVTEAFDNNVIPKNVKDFLINAHPKIPVLYLLPKIHKSLLNPPGRPIVSGVGSILEPLAQFVDAYLQPMVTEIPTCLKDTNDLLCRLEDLPPLPNGIVLASIDIQSLYTSIPQEEGIRYIEEALLDTTIDTQLVYFLLDCLTMVLCKNYFRFGGEYYWQRQGTSMGAPVAPSFANLFVRRLEEKFFLRHRLSEHIILYLRYVDDILILWNGTMDALNEMVNEANGSHETIQFTVEMSDKELHFLDVQLTIRNGAISTNLYRKGTDRNNLLHAQSFHNPSTVKAIPKGQFLRAKRIASTDDDYRRAGQSLSERFVQRGYESKHVKKVMEEVKSIPRKELLQKSRQVRQKDNRSMFVSKFVRHSKNIEKVIKKYWPVLQRDKTFGKLFKDPPRFCYRKGMSIRDMLCPSELPIEKKQMFLGIQKKGTFPCLNCVCCASIIKGSSINHPTKGNKLNLNDYATCESKGVIYMLKCPCGLVYVGQTIRNVKTRIKEHKGDIRNYKPGSQTDTTVARHFNEAKHSHGQLKWVVLEVVQPLSRGGNFKQKMLQREAKWISKLNSLAPVGLNDAWSLKCFL